MTEFLENVAEGWEWTIDDLADIAEMAREYAPAIKAHLNFTINDDISDVQVVHQLLSQLGIKTKFRWSREQCDHLGEKIRVYSLNLDHWDVCVAILERRQEKRHRLIGDSERTGSPLPLQVSVPMGDPGDKATEGTISPAVSGVVERELPLSWVGDDSVEGSVIENLGDDPANFVA